MGEAARRAEGIERVQECIAGRSRGSEPRRRVLDYLRGLLSPVECKHGWQLGEKSGETTPDGVLHWLSTHRTGNAARVPPDLRPDCRGSTTLAEN